MIKRVKRAQNGFMIIIKKGMSGVRTKFILLKNFLFIHSQCYKWF